MPNKTLTITQARHDLFKIADQVQRPNNYYTLSVEGEPKVVMMSYDEFGSIMETIDVMREFPNLKNEAKEAEEAYKKGNYITLDQILVKQGYVLADKSNKKYEVSSRLGKKGAKRAK